MHDLEIECIDLLLGEEEDALGDAEYLVGGEGALQPQVLHHALTGLQYSPVRAEIVTHSFSFIPGIFQKSHLPPFWQTLRILVVEQLQRSLLEEWIDGVVVQG